MYLVPTTSTGRLCDVSKLRMEWNFNNESSTSAQYTCVLVLRIYDLCHTSTAGTVSFSNGIAYNLVIVLRVSFNLHNKSQCRQCVNTGGAHLS